MKKWILAAFCLFAAVCSGQTYQPILQPHQTFVDGSGDPCAGCKLYSYQAGTTTPQATYTDSSGATQNTNPITLDAAGGANIWMGQSAYKFVLLDTNGTTLWTVDNVIAPLPGNQGPFLPLAGGTMSGNILMGSNNILNLGSLGIGTSAPGWPLDVENGGINTSAGYLYVGQAPLNHILLGNGTYYIDSATFPYASLSGVPTFYYQTLQSNGAALAQEPVANFSSLFSLSDNVGVGTNIDLAPSGVTAASYTNASITVDKYGRVTAASNGASSGGVTEIGSGAGCNFANDGNGLTCTTTVTLPTAMADTSYSATCAPQFSAAVATTTSAIPSLGLGWSIASTTTITIYEALNNGSSTGYGISPSYGVTVYCTAHHS